MKKGLLVLVLLTIVVAAPAFADTLTFVNATGEARNGVITYPYNMILNNGPITAMTCDTYDRHISNGETWNVTVNTMNTLGGTLFNNADMYMEAAWLIDHYPGNNLADINFAVWAVFKPALVAGLGAGEKAWYDAAVAFLADNSAGAIALKAELTSDLRIYTPDPNLRDDPNAPQEFLNLVPEPGSLVLFGTGLLSAVGVLRRRFSI